MSDLDNLTGMGFDSERAQLALKHGGGLQGALDYLEKSADTPIEDLQAQDTSSSSSQVPDPSATAQSLICNDCQKPLRTHDAAQFHASKTGHTDFSESTSEIAPLSAEEREAKLAEARARLAAKRAGEGETEKQERKRNEQIRAKATKEQADAKEELQKKEQLKEAQAKKREKMEDVDAKKRVQMKIKADKEERARKAAVEKAQREGAAPPEPKVEEPVKVKPAPQAKAASEYTEARLRIQTSMGTVQKSVAADMTLFEVAHTVAEEKGVEVESLATTFPKKTWEKTDFGQTVREAGWVPSAVIVVK